MSDEACHLSEALIFTANVVAQASPKERATIYSAYDEGNQLIAELASEVTSPRPGIKAIACAGWMLAAISARVDEQDLRNWGELKAAIDGVVKVLGRYRDTRLH
ncbi:hypothetical protein ACDY97_30290 [Rhizobium mongolense]|uniref:hypothetical protein n=1 Tax=Rhizobium mongolense TaxID=57676 RepID=UPI0035572794